MRSPIIVAAILSLAGLPVRGETPDPPSPPRVAVAIVVDQLAGWMADERLPRLPKTGGFARLLEDGTRTHLDYLHALTETAPDHAALYTAKTPRETGIFANYVRRDRSSSATVSVLADDREQLVGAEGPIPSRPGVGLALLGPDTLTEALLRRDPRATVIAISIKDRGSAFLGARAERVRNDRARRPELVWWDERSGGVITSTAFAPRLPDWVIQPEVPARFRWEAREGIGRLARTPDDQAGEAGDLGGRTFPHEFAATPRSFRFARSADRLVVDSALSAVRAAPRDRKAGAPAPPMLLALSFSRHDYIGHRFGLESWEAAQALVELDEELARLFAGLDAELGKDAYAVVLTADHGVAPLPATVGPDAPWCKGDDPFERPCEPGIRLSSDDLTAKLRDAVDRTAALRGRGDELVDRVVDSMVYLRDRERLTEAQARVLLATVRTRLASEPGVAEVMDACEPSSSLVRASIPSCEAPRGASDPILPALFILPKRGSFILDPPDVVGHGTPYLYDRRVPLLVRYPGGRGEERAGAKSFRSFYASLWYALTGETASAVTRAEDVVGIAR